MSQEQNSTETSNPFNVDDIFSKRKFTVSLDNEDIERKQEPEQKEQVKDKEFKNNPDKQNSPKIEDEEPKKDVNESSVEPEIDYKKELERVKKRLSDSQRSFQEDRKKLSSYKKAVEKMKEELILSDDEAALLLNHTFFEDNTEEVNETIPIVRYGNIWEKEMKYIKRFSSNSEELEQHFSAFKHLLQCSSKKEIEEIFNDLSQYEDDEIELTNQMLKLGQEYNDDIYSEIHEVGGIRNLKSKLYQKEQELQKKVDKLEKTIDKLKKKYEDYDTQTGNLRINSGSGTHDIHQKDTSFNVGKIFADRFKR